MPTGNWAPGFPAQSSIQVKTPLRLLAGAISGAALSLSYTGFYVSVSSWICVAILIGFLFGATPRIAFFGGFLHGLFFVLTSVPWIADTLALHGGVSKAGAWALVVLIAMAWGILTGMFALVVHRLSVRGIEFACFGAPFVWITFEFIRAHLPEISFPWNLLGYPASANPALVQITAVTGIFGLSFLAASFNALLAWVALAPRVELRRRLSAIALASALILFIVFVGPRFVPQPHAQHFARAVQLNFPETTNYVSDWFAVHTAEMAEVEKLSLQRSGVQPDLLVWPEAPAPFSYQNAQFAYEASTLAERFGHPFIFGSIELKWEESVHGDSHSVRVPYNSALEIDAHGQRIFSYDKVHLVPFGEYEPFPLIHRVVSSISDEVGGFREGTTYAVGRLPNSHTFGVFICYEAIYPGEVRRFTANGAQLLVNISNDGWFGRSAAAEQHLRMARVRAVENRRWMIRSTNNGFTVSVDPYGRIFMPVGPDVRAAVDLPYDFRSDKTMYARFGDWFAWLCVLVSVILLASTFRKVK